MPTGSNASNQESPIQPPLVVRDLGITYGETSVVRNVSFDVAAGQRVGLIGPSGAGKTSILNAIAKLVEPTSGTIYRFGNANTRGRAGGGLEATRIGMVHQQLFLTPRLRVFHNVSAGRLGRWSTLRSLWSLVRPVDTDEVLTVLGRLGLQEKIRARTDSLSGGQQQRVALARVLIQQPDLFLADEPVSAVDPAWSERVLIELTAEVDRRGASLLVVLHDVGLAKRFCDRLIGVRDGRVVFDLPTADVTTDALDALYLLAPAE